MIFIDGGIYCILQTQSHLSGLKYLIETKIVLSVVLYYQLIDNEGDL